MDIDIQKNGFYLALGGILVVYIIAYLAVVSPEKEKIKKQSNTLSGKNRQIQEYLGKQNNIPNDKIIEYYKQQRTLLEKNLADALEFFKEKDKELEKWFDVIHESLEKSGNKLPELDYFQVVYARERNNLINSYLNKTEGLKISKSKKDDFATDAEFDPKNKGKEIEAILPFVSPREIVTNSHMRRVQKQFWLIQNFLKFAELGKMKTLNKYKFVNQWQDGIEENFVTRTVEIGGNIEYGDIPFLVQSILNNKDFLTEITYLSVKRDTSYKPGAILVDVKWGQTEEQALKEYNDKNPDKGNLPLVEVTLRCDVLDYQGK